MSTASATPTGASAQLQARARRLRARAASLHPLLADTYRRRASELDLQALLEAVFNPPMVGLPTDGPGGTPIRPALLGLAA
jgi:hypothetical protein